MCFTQSFRLGGAVEFSVALKRKLESGKKEKEKSDSMKKGVKKKNQTSKNIVESLSPTTL